MIINENILPLQKPGLGFVFPGQGSQSLKMLAEIATDSPVVEATFQEASDVLNYDLWQLVQEGPVDVLNQTVYTQPALLAASIAIWRLIQSMHPCHPALLAGHSLGEYSALVAAEAFSFQEGIRVVALRGQYMQEAVPAGQGALAAIVGLENDDVQSICEQSVEQGEILTPANFNSPGQVVIAGHTSAVLRAITLAKAHKARLATLLPVSVPSHCDLMKPAAEKLTHVLAKMDIQVPKLPVVNNVDVAVYHDAASIREGLIRQLYRPVRWVEVIQYFVKNGIAHVIECGPGKVLTGLNKRIAPSLQLTQTGDLATLNASFLEIRSCDDATG